MHTPVDKGREQKSHSVATEGFRKQGGGESVVRAHDRPQAIRLRQLRAMANNSPHARHLRAIQTLANGRTQAAPLRGSNATIQLRPLRPDEQRRLEVERERLKTLKDTFDQQKDDLSTNLFLIEQTLAANDIAGVSVLREKADEMIPRLAKFFRDATDTAREAISSDVKLKNLTSLLNGYEFSGGKNELTNLLREVKRRSKGKASPALRDALGQITDLDEAFFAQYLKSSKPPMTVYRGNGIGVTANSLNGLEFTTIEPGGTRDVTFFGMVQHTHSNTFKNGMVSTTSSFDIAHGYATDGHNYGIVWEMLVTDYLHVANLLSGRNFKNRFPGQLEILIPGPVPASNIVSATLYQKDKKVGILKNR
jgi:hypothetical protein